MRSFWLAASFLLPFFFLLHGCLVTLVSAQTAKPSPWKTLTGNAPMVIANGGFSGLFPGSSSDAFLFSLIAGSPDTTLLCDVRLTEDSVGVCLQNLMLDNCTSIATIYPQKKRNYLVNGVPTAGWFSVDFTMKDLAQVTLTQGIYSRSEKFDFSMYPILAVEDVHKQVNPKSIWLNVQHDIFYTQHNLSMRNYIISISKSVIVNYISSPEVNFLKSIFARFQNSKTKLVFRFLNEDVTEPSTNLTYSALLKNLTFIKTFASGILIPKHYIWPITSDIYLESHTSVVMDAHKEGLEIYAADFANDVAIAYNYSYDPLAEILSFVDNGEFAVDGVVTDFPVTPSEAVGCYSHLHNSSIDHGKPFIVSHNGSSGDYPGCTDLAYKKAVDDGADIIDCPIQVTQEGTLICMSSINLMYGTNVIGSPFGSSTSTISELQSTPGIFTFNLTWDEIQKNLKPSMLNPEIAYNKMVRNPRYQYAGNFMKLSDFLSFAKGKALSGILISIENAAFLAERLGISITDGVIIALNEAGYNNQTAIEVIIQSTDSSVLVKMKQQTKFKLMYKIGESVRDALPSSIADIKKFADSVAVSKQSIYPDSRDFIINQTNIVNTFQKAGLPVYVYFLQNEYVSQAWDFFSDPYVEINSFVQGTLVDGIITDFPESARRYKRNSCRNLGKSMPSYMQPVQVGGLKQLIVAQAQPPALAPMPVLEDADVLEPPLPPVRQGTAPTPPGQGNASAPSTQPSFGQAKNPISSVIISMIMLLCSFLLI
ncbi:putative glycerophosphoryl diester phosphodiesterase 2 [Apostasia shenzhenica]|uniref:glycerophosphodiester phosphodiesterase n=1 Tax=Apostasia shenzhenica TaxID=1088818 RepID=A0A2H9ZVJ6_9ASPA|nr:putative glycerophosphoryl diester phosphodiesterase 2 [Apostasia shenzhenica]